MMLPLAVTLSVAGLQARARTSQTSGGTPMRAGAGLACVTWLCLACTPNVTTAQGLVPGGLCHCAGAGADADGPGTIWRGDRMPSLDEIAELAAPVLWFSPDEPLIAARQGPLPSPLPCDRSSDVGVVYYRLHALVLSGSERVSVPEADDPRFFEKVRRFTLRYFFYYKRDIGFSGHEHDLEGAEFEMALERKPDGCHTIRVIRVRGFAHGVDWYWNELQITDDTRFPLTMLVEEGKHASAPDRNADGMYTPGYDVNRRVNDAWGVRDVLGSGYLAGTAYAGSMTKLRRPDTRAFPLDSTLGCPVPVDAPQSPSRGLLNRYELRRAGTVTVCDNGTAPLARLMKSAGWEPGHKVPQYEFTFAREVADEISGTKGLIRNISFRYEDGPGIALILPGIDLHQGYIVPKINITGSGSVSFQGLLTTSAARLFGPYLALGAGHQQVTRIDPESPNLTKDVYKWKMVTEVGAKFRFRVTGKARIFTLGYNFAGVRIGLSAFGFSRLDMRLIAEIGAGVW
jgi:hypothetical protein